MKSRKSTKLTEHSGFSEISILFNEPNIFRLMLRALKALFTPPSSLSDSAFFLFVWIDGISYNIHVFLVLAIQLFHLLAAPSWIQVLGALVACCLSGILYLVAQYRCILDSLEALSLYLNDELLNNFVLDERKLEDYIEIEKIDEIQRTRPYHSFDHPIFCRVFVRKPLNSEIIPGQKKGFVIPRAYIRSLDSAGKSVLLDQPMSMIFIDDDPEEISNIGRYFLFHEIGHTTEASWKVKYMPYLAQEMIFGSWVWLALNTNNWILTLLAFMPYIYVRLSIDQNLQFNELDGEVNADFFAITKLPKEIFDVDSNDPRRNLEKLLKRNLLCGISEESIKTILSSDDLLVSLRNVKSRVHKLKAMKNYIQESQRELSRIIDVMPEKLNNVRRMFHIIKSIRVRKDAEEVLSRNDISSKIFAVKLGTEYCSGRMKREYAKIIGAVLLIPALLTSNPVTLTSLCLATMFLVVWFIVFGRLVSLIEQKTRLVETLIQSLSPCSDDTEKVSKPVW